MTGTPATPESSRFLERVLLFTFAVHAMAMVTMAVLLLPGLPGGGGSSDVSRITYIAAHPWLWRLGWFPWQLTALSDVLLGAALVRTKWIPRIPAAVTLIVTVIAVVPDQAGQLLWCTRGVALAVDAVRTGELARYLSFEASIFQLTAAWGATFYTLAALGWTWCFVAAGTWNRLLSWLSAAAWSIFAFVSIGPLLPADLRPAPALIAAGNAIGFILLQIWFAAVLERVLRRSRRDEVHGRYAHWRSTRGGIIGCVLNVIANSRLVRFCCEFLPAVGFSSDIRNVIYINYLVEAQRLEPFVPKGLELQRLGDRYALFTFLTYRHGHFGPSFFGPLRRLLPSPIQTNWRIHVSDPQTKQQGIYFVTNAIDSTLHAMPARLIAEGMPMHILRKAELHANNDGTYQILLDPGEGSAPEARATLRTAAAHPLPPPWKECFKSYRNFLAYCVPQDRAMSSQPWHGWVTRQEINLGIPLDMCEPLEGEVVSRTAEAIVGSAAPLCFRVSNVAFRFSREERDRRSSPGLPGRPS
jgi:hypothetical protein